LNDRIAPAPTLSDTPVLALYWSKTPPFQHFLQHQDLGVNIFTSFLLGTHLSYIYKVTKTFIKITSYQNSPPPHSSTTLLPFKILLSFRFHSHLPTLQSLLEALHAAMTAKNSDFQIVRHRFLCFSGRSSNTYNQETIESTD
jgi:hypothetical protein